MASSMDSKSAAENAQSVKVLDDLMQKLTISKEADAVKEASQALATFINGGVQDLDVPTK
jgi:elongation factor 3